MAPIALIASIALIALIALIVLIALIALIVLILVFSCLKLIKQAFVSAALSMEEEVKLPPHVGDILLSLAVEEDECCDVAAALPAVGSAMLSQAVEQGGDCLLPPAVGEEYGDCLLRVTNSALPSREVERFQGVSSSHEVSSFHEVLGAAAQRETLLYKIRVGWEQQRAREENRGSADRVLQYPCDGPTLDRLYELATLDVGDLTQEHRCRLGMQPSCAEMQCLAYLPLCFHVRLCLDLRAETRRLEEARMAYLAELDQAAAPSLPNSGGRCATSASLSAEATRKAASNGIGASPGSRTNRIPRQGVFLLRRRLHSCSMANALDMNSTTSRSVKIAVLVVLMKVVHSQAEFQ